jgi:hypothetical protein
MKLKIFKYVIQASGAVSTGYLPPASTSLPPHPQPPSSVLNIHSCPQPFCLEQCPLLFPFPPHPILPSLIAAATEVSAQEGHLQETSVHSPSAPSSGPQHPR